MGLYTCIFLTGLRRAYKPGALISEGAYNLNRKSTSRQAIAVLIKIWFAFNFYNLLVFN